MKTYTWHTSKPDSSSPATIHQILAYGSLKAITAARKQLGKKQLKDTFLNQPQKVYTPSALHFVTKFILRIKNPIDETRYLKTTPRYIG